MRAPEQVIKRPLLTEKGTFLKETGGRADGDAEAESLSSQILFEVLKDANKIEIRNAVQKLWNVNVLKVRTAIVRGKEKRLGRFTMASKGKSCRIVPVGYPAFGSFPVAVILMARASFLRLRWKM